MTQFEDTPFEGHFPVEDHLDYDEFSNDAFDVTANPSTAADRATSPKPSISARLAAIERLLDSRLAPISEFSNEMPFYNWLKLEYKKGAERSELFGIAYLNGEPAWNILLDLCIAAIEGKRISVTSACIASGAPLATALRWIALLERDELVGKSADQSDKRRTFVFITKKAHSLLKTYHSHVETEYLCSRPR